MARYQLTLAYDGTDFFGSQRQVKKRTVQGELEKALYKLGWTGRSILLSGRTDTGGHPVRRFESGYRDSRFRAGSERTGPAVAVPAHDLVQEAGYGSGTFHCAKERAAARR